MEYIHTNATWNIYIPTQHGIYTYQHKWNIYTPIQFGCINGWNIHIGNMYVVQHGTHISMILNPHRTINYDHAYLYICYIYRICIHMDTCIGYIHAIVHTFSIGKLRNIYK